MAWARPRPLLLPLPLLLLLAAGPGLQLRPGFQDRTLLSSYEIIIPQRLARERRAAPGSSVAQAQDKVSYVIEIEGKEHTIHLEKNTQLLPKDFTVYSYNEEGKLYSENPDIRDHCHYQGYVEGIPDSAIAVSTCTGLRGLLHVGNVTYGIEPMDDDSDLKHIVYRLENVQKEPMVCGVSSTDPGREHTEYEQPPGMTQLLRVRTQRPSRARQLTMWKRCIGLLKAACMSWEACGRSGREQKAEQPVRQRKGFRVAFREGPLLVACLPKRLALITWGRTLPFQALHWGTVCPALNSM